MYVQVGDPLEVIMHMKGRDDTTLRCVRLVQRKERVGGGGGAAEEVV